MNLPEVRTDVSIGPSQNSTRYLSPFRQWAQPGCTDQCRASSVNLAGPFSFRVVRHPIVTKRHHHFTLAIPPSLEERACIMSPTCTEVAMSEDASSAAQEFSPNSQVGMYRIEERIGAGGMGVVFRATDTKLGRSVALKTIRAELLHEEGLARFEREARVLASLNHPRVAAIYGMEKSGGTQFLVLEYVPGPTLADRLRRGRLPIREAMLVGSQIAEAMEAAHVKGIIHRDLKPGNIKVSESWQVKVLDFGLAKTIERVRAVSTDSTATVTESVTAGITIAGTAAYMSPEQACGKTLDSRTDIWSFGCVLYEMLSGKQIFHGNTLTEILAAVVEREPDWTALPAETPEPVRALLVRCLRKDAAHRLRDIGDARIELDDTLSRPASATVKPAGLKRRTAISAIAGAAAGAAATGVFAISRWRGVVPRNLTRFAIDAPDNGVFIASFNGRIGISPDGGRIAFNCGLAGAGPQLLYLRSVGELEAQRVKELRSGGSAFFSPDGRWVGFISNGIPPLAIHKVARSGDTPVRICFHEAFGGATWAEGDTVYWMNQNVNGLMSVPAAGGEPKVVTKVDFAKGERIYRHPCTVPGGHVLFTATAADTATYDDARIMAFLPQTGKKRSYWRAARTHGTRPDI